MKKILVIVMLIPLLVLAACDVANVVAPVDTPTPTEPPPDPPTPTPTEEPPEPPTLEASADAVINALAEMDMEAVAEYAHPEMGVRFSPYTYVREEHQVFMAEELPGLVESDEEFLWGQYVGTGDPIELTFEEYYEEFIYPVDFADPEEMAISEEIGWSSMINNIEEFYPDSTFVEYHFSGFDPEFEGLDWRSLRLVFIQEEEVWFLVGVVHDQWTP